jgi:hypothetical protein
LHFFFGYLNHGYEAIQIQACFRNDISINFNDASRNLISFHHMRQVNKPGGVFHL